MPGKNPPRKTKIRGQRHMLAYITPDEAALLKARGGTGELHKGIPSYPDYGDSGGFSGSGGGEAATGGSQGGNPDRGGADKNFDSGYSPSKSYAEKKLDKQIAKGKKNISQMTGLEQLMAALAPGAGFETAQNLAAQYMGGRMQGVLSQVGSRAVIDPRTGRVEGAYDAAGRLTGRDTKRDTERATQRANRGGAGIDGPRLLPSTASATEDEEEKRKTVIRSDLAKESERQRRRARRTGARGLGSRSLLSNVSRLGA